MRFGSSLIAVLFFISCAESKKDSNEILLKEYRPKSIYKTEKVKVERTSFPIIDMHSHPYAKSETELDNWVKTMDQVGVEKTIILSYQTGSAFDSLVNVYGKYEDRFDLWCGFDYTGFEEDGWVERAIKELERCKSMGAKGVGELGDKGLGLLYSKPTPGFGLHIDDPLMQPLLARCGELNMPINIHVAEPYWMYLPADSTNDGMMNARRWKINLSQKGMLDHEALINTLERAVENNPNTIFIACHFANCSYDLSILGNLMDQYPNLYADISARYAETATIPRYMKAFYKQYQDKLLYGTDMGMTRNMYDITFRILESEDEHFYEIDQFNYHWPLYGFGLDTSVLKKVYHTNALKVLSQLNSRQ